MNKFIRQASDSNKTDRQTDILKVCWENYYAQFVCHRCLCLSVREHISMNRSSRNLYADPLWPWLGPPLAALRYRGRSLMSIFINKSIFIALF